MRRARRAVQRVRVGQPVLLGAQLGVLAVGRLDPLDLGQPAAQVLGLGDPLPGLAGQLGQLGLHLPVPLVGPLVVGGHGGQARSGETVQRLPLAARPEQLLLVGLAVHGDQVIGQVGEQRDRHRVAARVSPGASLRGHRAAQQQGGPVIVEFATGLDDLLRDLAGRVDPEAAFHRGPVRPRPDPGRVRPAAEHQAEAGDDHGLAGPGLAGDDREPGR